MKLQEGFSLSSRGWGGEKFSKRILEGWFTDIIIIKKTIFSAILAVVSTMQTVLD